MFGKFLGDTFKKGVSNVVESYKEDFKLTWQLCKLLAKVALILIPLLAIIRIIPFWLFFPAIILLLFFIVKRAYERYKLEHEEDE